MTASSTPSSAGERSAAEKIAAEIDASCRLPLFALFGGAGFWLLLSSILGLIASIKFHGPNFLADAAWLTYGRVFPASNNALVYGFCIPAGLGVGLWILARLGRVTIRQPWLIAAGAKLWNLGVLVAVLGILSGAASGFEWLEMSKAAAIILFVAFVWLALCIFSVYGARRQREMYPSQWFVLAALFWFPWIFSTASLLLQFFPVRGVAQWAVAWWYSGNLLYVWLALMGLAVTFYLIPKIIERPLQSHYLALFVFWTLIVFGTWIGIPPGATLPAWMPAMSRVAAYLSIVPALGVALIVIQTIRGTKVTCGGGSLCFTRFGVLSLVLSMFLLALAALPDVARVTEFTWFGTAQSQLRLYGFFAMTMFGAAYYVLPRTVGSELGGLAAVRIHFWCGVIGVVLLVLPLAVGGFIQGAKLANPEIPFADVSKASLMFLRLSTVGETLLLLGNLIFFFNVSAVIVRFYRHCSKSAYAQAIAPLKTSEAKA